MKVFDFVNFFRCGAKDDVQPDMANFFRNFRKWPDGIIYYEICNGKDSNTDFRGKLKTAMKHIEDRSCVRFKERKSEYDYVAICLSNGFDSTSQVARRGGRQLMFLGEDGISFGLLLHELMHTIGFEHEHQRFDRDDYITIHWDNIEKKSAFWKLDRDEDMCLTEFDYDSIMLYGSFVGKETLPCMTTLDGKYLVCPSKKDSLSPSDVKRINMMYQCKRKFKFFPFRKCVCSQYTQSNIIVTD